MRVDEIRQAILNMSGDRFEQFVIELLRRDLFPGLIPTSPTGDLGEDARTSGLTRHLHSGRWVTIAVSMTSTIAKIRHDCQRCLDTSRTIDDFVFVTSGAPTRETQDGWRDEIEQDYPWAFECLTIAYIAPTAARPENEDLALDYLEIPPLGGDYLVDIKRKFAEQTAEILSRVDSSIQRIRFQHPQLAEVKDFLASSDGVILLGGPGAGKSTIAVHLAQAVISEQENVLLVDSRYLAGVNSKAELRQFIDLNQSLVDAFTKLAEVDGCMLVIDQFDSVAGSRVANLLLDLALNAVKVNGAKVLVVTRDTEDNRSTIRTLTGAGFQSVEMRPLPCEFARNVLIQIGIQDPPTTLLALADTPLNLDLIAHVHSMSPEDNLASIHTEVALWREFFRVVEESESVGESLDAGRQLRAEATRLAQQGLSTIDRTVFLDIASQRSQRRLVDWEILRKVSPDTRIYRFRHEQLQDYLVATNAFALRWTPGQLISGIDPHKLTGVATWLAKLYQDADPEEHARFLRNYLDRSSPLPFFSQVAILSEYLHRDISNEPPAVIDTILNTVQNVQELRMFFFDARPHASWASQLWSHGFFAGPPPPVIDEQGRRFLSQWDVQRYLILVATDTPQVVMQHAMTVEGEGWYIKRALDAVCRIPATQALPVVTRIAQWYTVKSFAQDIDYQAYQLMLCFADAGEVDAAFAIFEAMIAPRLPLVEDGLDIPSTPDYLPLQSEHYELLTHELPGLARLDLVRLATTVEQGLRAVLSLAASPGSYGAENANWRSAIEDTDQDIHHSGADKLLVALRKSMQCWIDIDPESATPEVQRMLTDGYVIFRRLAMHLIAYAPQQFLNDVVQQLLNAHSYDNAAIHHEFFQLIERGFPHLSTEHQEHVLDIILFGPPEEQTQEIMTWLRKMPDADPESEMEQYIDRWKRDRLFMAKDYLPQQVRQILDNLVKDLGIPDHPDFQNWHKQLSPVHSTSPLTEQQVLAFSQADLVDFLRSYHPSEHTWPFGGESVTTLASVVASALLTDSEENRDKILAVAEIGPQFVRPIVGRLSNNQETPIVPWGLSLMLSSRVIHSCVNPVDNDNVMRRDWIESCRTVLRLLERGCEPATEFPPEVLHAVRSMLLPLVDGHEPEWTEGIQDWATSSQYTLSTQSRSQIRPLALSVLLRHMSLQIRYNRSTLASAEGTGSDLRIPQRLDDQLRGILSTNLDSSSGLSPAVRYVYGQYLPILYRLDPEWTAQNIDHIFPDSEDSGSVGLYVAAWEGFILNRQYIGNPDFMALLRPKYLRAIAYLAAGHFATSFDLVRNFADHAIGDYLLGSYLLGVEGSSDEIAVAFFRESSPDARSQAAWIVWQICQQQNRQDFWPRIRMLWEWRVALAAVSPNPRDFADEMSYFAHLPQTVRDFVPLQEIEPQLKTTLLSSILGDQKGWGWDSVDEYLALRVDCEPALVIEFMSWMVDIASTSYHIEPNDTRRGILSKALGHEQTRAAALILLDKLGRKGVVGYRDLYLRYA